MILPSQLFVGKFETSSANVENINLHQCTTPFIIPEVETLMYDITEYVYDNDDSTSKKKNILKIKSFSKKIESFLSLTFLLQKTLILFILERKEVLINLCL